MRPEERDAAWLWDMLDHARNALALTAGCTWETYERDRSLQLATERLIEIIGEAARQVSQSYKAAHAEVPWRRITGQRHIIAHDYRRIDYSLVWEVLTDHLPNLVVQLEQLLSDFPPEAE